jgi:hypothetical protein
MRSTVSSDELTCTPTGKSMRDHARLDLCLSIPRRGIIVADWRGGRVPSPASQQSRVAAGGDSWPAGRDESTCPRHEGDLATICNRRPKGDAGRSGDGHVPMLKTWRSETGSGMPTRPLVQFASIWCFWDAIDSIEQPNSPWERWRPMNGGWGPYLCYRWRQIRGRALAGFGCN